MTRWLLLMLQFNIIVIDRPGKDNLDGDFLSRINSTQEAVLAPTLDDFLDENLFAISTLTPWFTDMANYLVTRKFPQNISTREKHNIVQQGENYSWIDGDQFYTGPDLIMRRYVREYEMFDVLNDCHNEPCGGNFTDKRTTYKVLHAGYYWPTLFKDAKNFVSICDACQ